MNLIPIDPDKLLSYKNEECDITFFYNCLNGENSEKKDQLIYDLSKNYTNDQQIPKIEILKLTDKLFDLFVKGWESNTIKLPPFPEDNKPSRCFADSDAKDFLVWKIILPSFVLSDEDKKK